MPRCQCSWAINLFESELPVLPFLAPRLFKPWPEPQRNATRRIHTPAPNTGHSRSQGLREPGPISQLYSARPQGQNGSPPELQQKRPLHIGVRHVRTDHEPSYSRSSSTTATQESSRHKTAREWYEHAVAGGLEELLVAKHEEDWKSENLPWNVPQAAPPKIVKEGKTTITVDAEGISRYPNGAERSRRRKPLSVRRFAISKKTRTSAERELAQRMHLMRVKGKEHALYKWNPKSRKFAKPSMRELRFSWTRPKFVRLGVLARKREWAKGREPGTSPEWLADSEEEELVFITGHFSTLWNTNFAKLQARYDATGVAIRSGTLQPRRDIELHPRAEDWARAILATEGSKVNRSAIVLQDGQHYSWSRIWLHSMQWVLLNDIDQAIRFLDITNLTPHLPQSWITDVLLVLSMHYTHDPPKDGVWTNLIDVYLELMDRPASSSLKFEGSHIRLLLPHCSADQMLTLRTKMREYRVSVHGWTHLHSASALARKGLLEESIEALLEAASNRVDVNTDAFKSTCTTILRRCVDHPGGLRLCLRIVSNLVDLGVVINVQLCNVVMLNAAEAGDMQTAFSTYHSLVAHRLAADAYTFAVLLKGCKNVERDGETLTAMIQDTIKNVDVRTAPVLATEILHSLYLHHFHRRKEMAFANLTNAYTNLFDPGPLVRLGILSEPLDPSEGTLMTPTPAALGVMIAAWLRHQQRSRSRNKFMVPRIEKHLYDRFRFLVRARDPDIGPLIETDFVCNAFLTAFVMTPPGMPFAAQVMKDMQSYERFSRSPAIKKIDPTLGSELDHPPSADPAPDPESETPPSPARNPENYTEAQPSENKTTKLLFNGCQPTTHTWSIFLHGFTRHKRLKEAEQVMEYMREQGITPNQVTWNTLINGYVGIQDAEGAFGALHRMETEGLSGNDITALALARMKTRLGEQGKSGESDGATQLMELSQGNGKRRR